MKLLSQNFHRNIIRWCMKSYLFILTTINFNINWKRRATAKKLPEPPHLWSITIIIRRVLPIRFRLIFISEWCKYRIENSIGRQLKKGWLLIWTPCQKRLHLQCVFPCCLIVNIMFIKMVECILRQGKGTRRNRRQEIKLEECCETKN